MIGENAKPIENKKNTLLWTAAALICAAVGVWTLLTSMSQGAGIGGDATIYITSARNLLAGKGLGLINAAGEFRLIPYFPPFYSLVLAFFGLFFPDLPQVALILNLVLFAGLIYLLTRQTIKLTNSLFPGVLFGLLLAGSPILIPAYSWAMSEPLAIFLGFSGLILLEKNLTETSDPVRWASALLLGLSFLTRYSSAAFIGAAVLLLLCCDGEKLKNRFLSAFTYGLAASIPMIIWLVIDYTQTSTVGSRSMLSGKTAELWAAFLPKVRQVFLLWFVPESMSSSVPEFYVTLIGIGFVLLMIAILICSFLKLRGGTRYARMFFLLSAFNLLYLLLIIYVSLNTYPPITINSRMLLPMYIANFWLIVLLIALIQSRASQPAVGWILNGCFCLFVLFSSYRGVRIARQNAIDGLGYHSAAWKNSETAAYIRENIPEENPIVTNEETALLFLLDRRTWPMHEVYVSEPDPLYYAYESEIGIENDGSRQTFRKGDAYLVVFDTFEDQMADIYGDETQARIEKLFENLNVLFDGDDGKIYTLEAVN